MERSRDGQRNKVRCGVNLSDPVSEYTERHVFDERRKWSADWYALLDRYE